MALPRLHDKFSLNRVQSFAIHASGWKEAATWRKQDAEFAESQRRGAERTMAARKDMDAKLFDAMLAKAGAHKLEQGISEKTRQQELLLNRPLVERMAQSGFKPERTVAMLKQASSHGLGA
ncbi:unnamed protein product [Symbiodinium natans]|uniref:Uncharacterized protein n=1 Tax=Symbiodinium natans TaxID=878477 RepID=A0A812JJU9_9DINO|nr:unnamed protein product [Symbiodinium natans]